MKMKKTFWVVPLMLLASMALTSCGEDDNNEQVSKPNSGQNSGSNSGNTSGGTTSKTQCTRVSTERIIVVDGSKKGNRYYGQAYKWVYPNGEVKLTLGSNGEYLLGFAKKNTDSYCYGVALSKRYSYKVVKYELRTTSYYYFN